ncbi:para-aminobenzoate synthase [Suhomyces tanzawaensis NRRL Y-17324]|uniref:aminodeoxychorismate synthase n=1 Tax=Suhomyces tanzawaensis NRRL Y-17324 TaxID=984487 RepID=A0A1E4SHR3_9ASCO|nr:para-aminobenzoate synthase [Suhomyces tanzawaensis NRRL Y-17324]ODV79035.1 para-aminobenzoate synthase [Suhomyces tanzawaensis NRRL Y-17324]
MILLIDSYDSFTNNLANLLEVNAGQKVVTIRNDSFEPETYEEFFHSYLPLFEYVVVGPGPGHPSIESDVGIISWLFRRYRDNPDLTAVPILGICLGFQSLCYEFGNEVSRLTQVKHGQVYEIHPISEDTILGDGTFKSVRYHSLYVENLNDSIIPLAHCYETDGKKILMAVKHKELPFYGVQYHPESICSSNGDCLISNFTNMANVYNQKFRPEALGINLTNLPKGLIEDHAISEKSLISDGLFADTTKKQDISLKKFQLGSGILPIDICEHLYKKNKRANFILLNSASIPGEWSIIGFPIDNETEVITHSLDEASAVKSSSYGSHESTKIELKDGQTPWKYISDKMATKFISRDRIKKTLGNYHSRNLPFFGGYLGLISYEEGQHILLDKLEPISSTPTPDLKLAFITRFMIYDHLTNDWFVVSIRENDAEWVESFSEEAAGIEKVDIDSIPFTVADLCEEADKVSIQYDFPSQSIYKDQFEKCQEYLHSGDSYELCLTTQLKISLPSYIQPWDIYKVLTLRKNPSPFSCFMEFDDCVLISSSPERFLSWKDDNEGKKLVELRPIKGTVRNTPDVDINAATEILKTPKEMGENLMIVDLIRHDLFEFAQDVQVSQLMSVEEYKTVFQLVSVIQGKNIKPGYSGIDVLHKSLPPGSMTGAPKKRSVELLQQIESMQSSGPRRGIYSGVVGYWSVTDDADWSVIIRSTFRYTNDKANKAGNDTWRIGAGGAITVLSDLEGEWEEMKIKLSSALQAFK